MTDALQEWILQFNSGMAWFNKLNSDSTKKTYLPNLKKYCDWAKKNPDELIQFKIEGLQSINTSKEFQAENLLETFISTTKFPLSVKDSIRTTVISFFKNNRRPLVEIVEVPTPESKKRCPKTQDIVELENAFATFRDKALLWFIASAPFRLETLTKLKWKDLKESAIKMCELENGRISSFMLEKRYVKKDGTVIDGKIMVSAVRNRNGKPSLFVAELEDITCARRVQDALMKSELQYRQLVNVAQEGIWALDSNYQTIFVNPRMAEMLGYAESEMVGKNLFEFVDKKRIEQSKQFLGQFKQGAKGHFDYEFTRKDGSHIYVSIAASVISDDEGKPLGTLAMVSDISYRKALETKVNNYSKHLKSMVELRTIQLKDANERLVKSERLAAIGELSGMVGHDLRNPLTGIKNAAYFLKKKGATISEAQAKEMLEIIDKAIDHSNKIINDLLDYSREMRLELTECEPRALLDEAVRMIQVPDRIQIVNHLLGETRIRVDADKMMRVFINLIKNAVDAMPEKGTLEITSRQTRDNLEIAFADTGVGIPEETLPKIFSPLFTTKAQGMGFGLAICKRIIESHEGTITVKTAASQGTTFTVTLPVKSKVEVGGEKTWINIPESLSSTTTRA
jgi:PAS domain S-box-containing protein